MQNSSIASSQATDLQAEQTVKTFKQKVQVYFNRKSIAIFLLCISEGAPISLIATALTVWLWDVGIENTIITFVAAIVCIPYTAKLLWAPLLDIVSPPILTEKIGRQRAWIVVITILLVLSILQLANTHPEDCILCTSLCAIVTTFLSASQNIVINAFRINLFKKKDQALGALPASLGHRIGMVASGAGGLFLGNYLPWNVTISILSTFTLFSLVGIYISGEPQYCRKMDPWLSRGIKRTKGFANKISYVIKSVLLKPFSEFTVRQDYKMILCFILFYKASYEFVNIINIPFLIELGYSKIEIATIDKVVGTYIAIGGAILGPVLAAKYGIHRTLMLALVTQAIASLGFMIQYYVQYNLVALVISMGIEKICSGLTASSLIVYTGMMCSNTKYTGTQYAIIYSVALLGRVVFGSPSGFIADSLSWYVFFVVGIILPLPSMYVLAKYHKTICAHNSSEPAEE